MNKDRAHVWFPTFVDPAGRDSGGAHPSFLSVSLFELPTLSPSSAGVFFFFLLPVRTARQGLIIWCGPTAPPPSSARFSDPPRPEISHNHVLIVGLVAAELGKSDIICDLCVNLTVNYYDKYIEFEYNQSHIHGYLMRMIFILDRFIIYLL